MKIIVREKRIYGRLFFYPVSDDAEWITRLLGKPTLLKKQIRLCIERGWEVKVLPQERIFRPEDLKYE